MSGVGFSVVPIESFEPPVDMSKAAEHEYRRRFSVLRLDASEPQRRGVFAVQKAFTAENRPVALCAFANMQPGGVAQGSDAMRARALRVLRDEQAALSRLSMFKCFPNVYGFGYIEGAPVIVEDWIESTPLLEAPRFLSRTESRNGMGPLDVAAVGDKLYGMLQALGERESEFLAKRLDCSTVVIGVPVCGLEARLSARDFELFFTTASIPGPDATSVLLLLLGAGPIGDAPIGPLEATLTRSEWESLVFLLRYGKQNDYDAATMRLMLRRWIRVHDDQRLTLDGGAPYSYRLDPRVFVPLSRAAERPRFGFFSNIVAEALDSAEGDVDWMVAVADETAQAPVRDRFRWWLTRNFMRVWTVLMLLYSAILFAIGWSLYG